jgi:hypothetical protein
MKVEIQKNISDEDLDSMKEVYQSVGWNKHTNEVIKLVFEASNVKVVVKCDGRIVGFGRAISDVVVHKEFQVPGGVHLISTTGNEEFYRKVGFIKVKTGMARYLNGGLGDEYLE